MHTINHILMLFYRVFFFTNAMMHNNFIYWSVTTTKRLMRWSYFKSIAIHTFSWQQVNDIHNTWIQELLKVFNIICNIFESVVRTQMKPVNININIYIYTFTHSQYTSKCQCNGHVYIFLHIIHLYSCEISLTLQKLNLPSLNFFFIMF